MSEEEINRFARAVTDGVRKAMRTGQNYDRQAFRAERVGESEEHGICCDDEPCIVQQQFAAECDVNTIVQRFGMVGSEPVVNVGGLYGDFTGIHDYEDALRVVRLAQEDFESLPAELRERFGNDPARLVAFAQASTAEDFEAEIASYAPVAAEEPATAPVTPPAAEAPASAEGG